MAKPFINLFRAFFVGESRLLKISPEKLFITQSTDLTNLRHVFTTLEIKQLHSHVWFRKRFSKFQPFPLNGRKTRRSVWFSQVRVFWENLNSVENWSLILISAHFHWQSFKNRRDLNRCLSMQESSHQPPSLLLGWAFMPLKSIKTVTESKLKTVKHPATNAII